MVYTPKPYCAAGAKEQSFVIEAFKCSQLKFVKWEIFNTNSYGRKYSIDIYILGNIQFYKPKPYCAAGPKGKAL